MALIKKLSPSVRQIVFQRGHGDEASEASAGNYLWVSAVIRCDTIREAIFIRHICSHFWPPFARTIRADDYDYKIPPPPLLPGPQNKSLQTQPIGF